MQLANVPLTRLFSTRPEFAPRGRAARVSPARAGGRDRFPDYDADDSEDENPIPDSPSGSWPPIETMEAARLRAWITRRENLARPNPDRSMASPLFNTGQRMSAAPSSPLNDSIQARLLRQFNALHTAAGWGNALLMHHLIDRKADINALDQAGNTPLLYAVLGGHAQAVRLLLKVGADIDQADSEGRTPLHHSASMRRWDIVFSLVSARADANAVDFQGATPLHYAAAANTPPILKLLLNHGAKIEAYDANLQDALGEAIRRGHLSAAHYLLDRGLSVNRQAPCGSTPLHQAVAAKRAMLIETLVARGADPEIRDMQGATPNDHAFFTGDLNVLMAQRSGEYRRGQRP